MRFSLGERNGKKFKKTKPNTTVGCVCVFFFFFLYITHAGRALHRIDNGRWSAAHTQTSSAITHVVITTRRPTPATLAAPRPWWRGPVYSTARSTHSAAAAAAALSPTRRRRQQTMFCLMSVVVSSCSVCARVTSGLCNIIYVTQS